MLLVSLISYIDRNTLALLAPTILRESGLTGEQYGWIISAFSVLYMIGSPLWGRILDRVGLRPGMTAAVTLWTLASAAHAWAGGFAGFALVRALLGFGEGATFPGGLRTVIQTLPPHLRARGTAIAYSGGSLGAVVTPLLVTPVVQRYGWRAAFLLTGLIGFAWLLLWAILSRRQDIREKPSLPARQTGVQWTDRRLWGFMCAYALGALPIAFVLYGAALYLGQALGASQLLIGQTLWIPPLGWEAGYLFWGWLVDRHLRGLVMFQRMLALTMVLSLPLALVTQTHSLPLVLALLFFAMFVAAGFIIMAVAYATREFASGDAGLLAGLGAGSWSAAVALVMPVLGRLFDQHRYAEAFGAACLFPIAGFLGWWWCSRPARTLS